MSQFMYKYPNKILELWLENPVEISTKVIEYHHYFVLYNRINMFQRWTSQIIFTELHHDGLCLHF